MAPNNSAKPRVMVNVRYSPARLFESGEVHPRDPLPRAVFEALPAEAKPVYAFSVEPERLGGMDGRAPAGEMHR